MPITDIAEEREPAQPAEPLSVAGFHDVIGELLGRPVSWDEAAAAEAMEPSPS